MRGAPGDTGSRGLRALCAVISPPVERLTLKQILAAALMALCTLCTLSQAADVSPAKKKLIDRVLQLQRSAIESQSRAMAEQPAMLMMQRAGQLLQTRVAPEKRDALAKEIQADLRKYSDEAVPLVREHAVRLMPLTIGATLQAQFSEAELKQLISAMEAPAVIKFQQANGDMMKSLSDKLVAEVRPELDPKIKALEQSISKRFDAAVAQFPGAPSSAPKP